MGLSKERGPHANADHGGKQKSTPLDQDADMSTEVKISEKTQIPLGWAVAVAVALAGGYVDSRIARTELQASVQVALRGLDVLKEDVRDVQLLLRNDYFTTREMRLLLVRLKELNPTLVVPTLYPE
jgi:hypothetical protein